jgi:hypothetical protein
LTAPSGSPRTRNVAIGVPFSSGRPGRHTLVESQRAAPLTFRGRLSLRTIRRPPIPACPQVTFVGRAWRGAAGTHPQPPGPQPSGRGLARVGFGLLERFKLRSARFSSSHFGPMNGPTRRRCAECRGACHQPLLERVMESEIRHACQPSPLAPRRVGAIDRSPYPAGHLPPR